MSDLLVTCVVTEQVTAVSKTITKGTGGKWFIGKLHVIGYYENISDQYMVLNQLFHFIVLYLSKLLFVIYFVLLRRGLA
jgi:hypothetical protein